MEYCIPFQVCSKSIGSKHSCQMGIWTIKHVLYVTTMVAMWLGTVHAQCGKINACSCKLPNGKIIDLSSIGNNGGSIPKFPYGPKEDVPFSEWEFSFNGCYAYSDEFCRGGVVCQRYASLALPGDLLGTPDTADYTDGTVLKFNAIGHDSKRRYTEVKLTCDEGGTSETSTLRRFGKLNLVYKYELISKCACHNGCSSGGGGGGDGLSIGSILCIIFSLLVIVYLVAGALFMKFVRGAEGKEIVPNVDTWLQIPSLIKDGTMFIVSFVKPGAEKSDYETL